MRKGIREIITSSIKAVKRELDAHFSSQCQRLSPNLSLLLLDIHMTEGDGETV